MSMHYTILFVLYGMSMDYVIILDSVCCLSTTFDTHTGICKNTKGNNADLFASEIYVAWNNIARNMYI